VIDLIISYRVVINTLLGFVCVRERVGEHAFNCFGFALYEKCCRFDNRKEFGKESLFSKEK